MHASKIADLRHVSNATLLGIFDPSSPIPLPLFSSRLSAGFGDRGEDHIDTHVDLNSLCLDHPDFCCLYRVGGESMSEAGIDDGDFLVVDRGIEARSGQIVAASYCGETLVKELYIGINGVELIAHHPSYPPLNIEYPEYFYIAGVVTWVLADKRYFRGSR